MTNFHTPQRDHPMFTGVRARWASRRRMVGIGAAKRGTTDSAGGRGERHKAVYLYFQGIVDRTENTVSISIAFNTFVSKSIPHTIATRLPTLSINGDPLQP